MHARHKTTKNSIKTVLDLYEVEIGTISAHSNSHYATVVTSLSGKKAGRVSDERLQVIRKTTYGLLRRKGFPFSIDELFGGNIAALIRAHLKQGAAQ